MGADLYIPSIQRARRQKYEAAFNEAVEKRNALKPPYNEEYQEQVDFYWHKMYSVGYFRDSYNNSNLLWRFDFSYWQNELKLNENGDLPPSEAKRLLTMLKEAEPIFEASLQRVRDEGWSDDPEDVIDYFRMKYLKLRVFLKMAIKLNESIYWSV